MLPVFPPASSEHMDPGTIPGFTNLPPSPEDTNNVPFYLFLASYGGKSGLTFPGVITKQWSSVPGG